MKRAVIAGATGVIGTALLEKLLQENMEVLVLVRRDSKRLSVIPEDSRVMVLYAGMEEYQNLQNDTGKEWEVSLIWHGAELLALHGMTQSFRCRTFRIH